MVETEDGGPAFPRTLGESEIKAYALRGLGPAPYYHGGMSMRDWFATHATEWDINNFMPKCMLDAEAMAVKLGWIESGAKLEERHWTGLRYWARYQHADAMLRARHGQP